MIVGECGTAMVVYETSLILRCRYDGIAFYHVHGIRATVINGTILV